MCGISGVFNYGASVELYLNDVKLMGDAVRHRGPDEFCHSIDGDLAFAVNRLAIQDLQNGHQPFENADNSILLICNGEIFNYKDLRGLLEKKGHRFKTCCDIEVIIPLYEEYGLEFLNKLNGQFALCLLDKRKKTLLLARDHCGICPLFYSEVDGCLVFASEIKAILKHPKIQRKLDLMGLDQMISFPANISPTTMFKGIASLPPGHYLKVENSSLVTDQYWDLDYPKEVKSNSLTLNDYIEELSFVLQKAVRLRLTSEVPVGVYLSGGLDSSLIGMLMKFAEPSVKFNSFSVGFPGSSEREINEEKYQRIIVGHLNFDHHQIDYNFQNMFDDLEKTIFHSECPLKENYNTCSYSLSRRAQAQNVKVVLCGEGADELFGGYYGYKIDLERNRQMNRGDLNNLLGDQIREQLWQDRDFSYEIREEEIVSTKDLIYSDMVLSRQREFNSLNHFSLGRNKLIGLDLFQRRSYIDFKLRLAGHLLADHGDRMTYANGVEGRYPFLDIELIEFMKCIPSQFKVNSQTDKYLLRRLAERFVPTSIVNRPKFSFVAPGSQSILKNNEEFVRDTLSVDRIRRQGYLNPEFIQRLIQVYGKNDFKINVPYEQDLLMFAITFSMFLDIFDLS